MLLVVIEHLFHRLELTMNHEWLQSQIDVVQIQPGSLTVNVRDLNLYLVDS